MRILCKFFFGGGPSQNLTIFRCHLYAFLGVSLRSRYRMGEFFFVWGGGGVVNFHIFFFGVLEIPDIFGGER